MPPILVTDGCILGKLRKQERGGRLLRTSLTVGIALLILTFSAGLVAQNAASGGVVPAGIYANHEKVAAALAKGASLVDNPNTPAGLPAGPSSTGSDVGGASFCNPLGRLVGKSYMSPFPSPLTYIIGRHCKGGGPAR
jgi:hypothetical protein